MTSYVSGSLRLPNFLLPILSVVLMVLSASPYYLWPLGFVALIPLLILGDRTEISPKTAVAGGYLMGSLFWMLGTPWLPATMTRASGSWFLTFTCLLPLGFLLHSRFTIFLLLLGRWQKLSSHLPANSWARNRCLAIPAMWGLAEFIGWQAIPVYGPNIVSGNIWFLQCLDLFGARGVSILWALGNLTIYEIIWGRRSTCVGFSLALLAAVHIYGCATLAYWSGQQEKWPTRSIVVVQGNTAGNATFRSSLQTLLDQSRAYLRANNLPDLLIWPEASVPRAQYGASNEWGLRIGGLLKAYPCPLLLCDTVQLGAQKITRYNRVCLVGDDSQIKAAYLKNRLTPVGEYLPDFLQATSLRSMTSGYTAGNEHNLFRISKVAVLPIVCYEALLGSYVRDFFIETDAQAQLLVCPASDSCFASSQQAEQAFDLLRLRSIELRRPVLRAGNCGVSALVDVVGRARGATIPFTRTTKAYTVKISEPTPTFYSLWGDSPARLYCLFFLFSFLSHTTRQKP